LIERRLKVESLCLLTTDCEHFRRVIQAIHVDALAVVIEQEPSCAATNIEHRLAAFTNDLAIEEAVLSVTRIPAQ